MRQSGEAPLKYCLLSPDLKYFDKHWEPKKIFFLKIICLQIWFLINFSKNFKKTEMIFYLPISILNIQKGKKTIFSSHGPNVTNMVTL